MCLNALNFLRYLRDNKRITSQQYKSIKGILRSNNEEAVSNAREFIKSEMYKMYPTDKDKFYFSVNGLGWSAVDKI